MGGGEGGAGAWLAVPEEKKFGADIFGCCYTGEGACSSPPALPATKPPKK